MNKFLTLKIIYFMYFLIVFKGNGANSQFSWTFEIKEVSTKSSNKDLMEYRLKNERVSRGKYALFGEWYLNYDIVEGDQNEVAMQVFRSPNNDGKYTKLPFDIPRNHFYKVINTQYKDAIMNPLHDCSDLPYFEDKIPQPIQKKTYTLNKCNISQDGLPNRLEDGTYKIVLNGYGDVEWEIEVIAEVETTLD